MTALDLIPMTKAAGFGALPEMLEQRASHSALLRVFRSENLPLEIVENRDTWLPVHTMMGAFEKAARATGERVFGLDVGLSMPHGAFGLWVEYCVGAETLRQALLRSARSSHFQQTGGIIKLEHEGVYSIWRYYPPQVGETNIQHSDHLLGPMLSFLSVFLGPDVAPAWLEMAYPRDPLAHLVEDRFDCPIKFGQAAVGVAFKTVLLDREKPHIQWANRTRQVTFLDLKANEAGTLYDEPVRSIASILILRLMEGKTDIEGTAQTAGYGIQTMQRLLRREGTSYREVLETVRCQRAKALLLETRLSIIEIGLLLGYSDHANFTRAFNRWAGCPPSVFRKMRLAPAEIG